MDDLTIAREVEKTIGADILRGEFDISHHKVQRVVTLANVWEKYLPGRRSTSVRGMMTTTTIVSTWHHGLVVRPCRRRFSFDIEKMKSELKEPECPRQALCSGDHQAPDCTSEAALQRGSQMGHILGENRVGRVQMPKIDNQEASSSWKSWTGCWQPSTTGRSKKPSPLLKFAMFTGLRRGELLEIDLGRRGFRA